jgi:hypothetical protein
LKIVEKLAFRWRAWRAVRETEREIRAEERAERKAERAGRPPGPAPASLRVPRALALAGISVLVGAASLTSFAESYRGLYDWAHEHGLSGLWAAVWPLQVDVFIAVGELALFVALADSWSRRSRIGAWTVTLGGLAVSVAGNIGHVHSHAFTNRATAAVPPLAAAAALAVGLGVLKRVVQAHGQGAPIRPLPDMSADHGPGIPADSLSAAIETRPETGTETGTGTVRGQLPGPVRPALPEQVRDGDSEPVPEADAEPVPAVTPNRSRRRNGNPSGKRSASRATDRDAEAEFATEIAAGQVPSLYQIRTRLHVGNERAKSLRQHIARQALST